MYLHTNCHKTILSYSSIKLDDAVAGTTIQMSCSSSMHYGELLSETALSPQKLVTVQILKIPCVKPMAYWITHGNQSMILMWKKHMICKMIIQQQKGC